MTSEDIRQLYKYGATPSLLAGVSEQNLLAFGGISKKANMGGDESGVAFRALMSAATSPTAGAKTALLAAGLNYANYQKAPNSLAVDPFAKDVAARYGVNLDDKAKGKLGKIFGNKDLISDPSKFTPAVVDVLKSVLTNKQDAKSLKSIAGAANRYRDASMKNVDVNGLITDLLQKLPGNLKLANAIFGSKQGGRIATALGNPAVLKHMIEELTDNSEGYAENIAEQRMKGYRGAKARFGGATKNAYTAIGRSWDNGGEGDGGPLTWITDRAGKLVQSFSELDNKTIMLTSAYAGWASLVVAAKGAHSLFTGFGLTASATALDGSALALTRAAAALGGAGAVKGALPGVAGPVAGTVAGYLGSTLLKGGAVAATIGTLAAIKSDSENGNPMRTYLRSLLGIEDPNEPAPWMPGGDWNKTPRARAAAPAHDDYPWLDDRPSNAQGDSMLTAGRYRFGPGRIMASDLMPSINGGQPVDVTGKVQLEGSADVRVQVNVTGQATATGFAASQGNIKASVGTTTVGSGAAGPSAN